jgi:serine/threonine-protein kinase
VQVLDVNTLAEGDPYMVMEYLEGRDLKRELVKRGPLPVAEAVGYLIQACTGLSTAHGAGIIHRDIKPANIFITNLDGEALTEKFLVLAAAGRPGDHNHARMRACAGAPSCVSRSRALCPTQGAYPRADRARLARRLPR